MTKMRPIVGTTENLELLVEIATRNVQEAREQSAYYHKAIQAGRKKLNDAIKAQKAAKAIIRRRAKLGDLPPDTIKILLAQKASAAYQEATVRSEIANFKHNFNIVREVEFTYASMLKLIEERKNVSSNT